LGRTARIGAGRRDGIAAKSGAVPIVFRTLAVFTLLACGGALAFRGMERSASTPRKDVRPTSVSIAFDVTPPPVAPVVEQPADPEPAPGERRATKGLGYFTALLDGGSDLAERDRADAEDQNELLKFEGTRVRRALVGAIDRAARRVGVDAAMLMAIADKESSFASSVKASTSSATGLFQFIESTWLRSVRQFGPAYGLAQEASEIQGSDDKPFVADPQERERILAMRNYPYLSALLAAECIRDARGKLAEVVGREPTVGETYLTHFLGTQGASLFMQKFVDQPKVAAASVFAAPARANKPIFFAGKRGKALSIAGVHDKFEDMMDARVRRYARAGQQTRALAYSE
jgi:hypothetical protein